MILMMVGACMIVCNTKIGRTIISYFDCIVLQYFFLMHAVHVHCDSETRILESMLAHYNPAARPVTDLSKALIVSTYVQLKKMDKLVRLGVVYINMNSIKMN